MTDPDTPRPGIPPVPPASHDPGQSNRQSRQTRQAARNQKKKQRSHKSKSTRARYIADMVFTISVLSMKKDRTRLEKTIFNNFKELGGIYVKFLQLIVLKTRFFTMLTPKDKMSVYDEVEPEYINVDRVLQHELGPHYRQSIVDIERTPFACGSFGQVYRAQLVDGTAIVVKILRPSLIQYVKSDLRVIGVVAKLLRNRIKMATDIGAFYKDFRTVVLRETDYVQEVRNADYFHEYFHGNQHIIIPKSYPELSSKYVITQDYVGGLPMTQLILAKEAGYDPVAYTREMTGSDLHVQMDHLGTELIKSMFLAERIFGDPHPGNIKLLPNNQVALVDFGIAGQPPIDRKAFMILMEDVVGICGGNFDPGITFINGMRYFTPDLYRAINSFSMLYRGGEHTSSEIMLEVRKAAEKALATSSKQADLDQLIKNGKISTIMNQVINDGNKFSLNVVMDPGTIVTIRTADGYVSLLEELRMIEAHIPSVIKKAIDATNEASAILKGRSETMDFEMAVNVIGDWMQGLIESDPMFFAPLIKKLRYAMVPPPAYAAAGVGGVNGGVSTDVNGEAGAVEPELQDSKKEE